MDFRPAFALTLCIAVGFATGYYANSAWEPRNDKPDYEKLEYADFRSKESFPHTFQSRQEAVAWLETQIAFIDKYHTDRAIAEHLKRQWKMEITRPNQRINRYFLIHVREEAELALAAFEANPPTDQGVEFPSPTPSPRRRERPVIEK